MHTVTQMACVYHNLGSIHVSSSNQYERFEFHEMNNVHHVIKKLSELWSGKYVLLAYYLSRFAELSSSSVNFHIISSRMAAALSALNAKIRSQPVLNYLCSTRTFHLKGMLPNDLTD